MTWEIAFVLGLLVAAVILFSGEWLSIDVVTLLVLLALVIFGTLTPQEAFSGFANDIIIILCSIFVLSKALLKTGVMESLASLIARFGGRTPVRLLMTVMLSAGSASAFMNNTTATAVFLPGVLGVCRRNRIRPRLLLMPLAFASILGGTCSLIGTSTNVAVSGYLQKVKMPPFGLFEFSVVGVVLMASGLLYMILVGRHLLPGESEESFTEQYQMKEFLSEVRVTAASPLLGVPLESTELPGSGATVLEVVRGSDTQLANSQTRLKKGDVIIVKGSREALLRVRDLPGLRILDSSVEDSDLVSADVRVAEALVSPGCGLLGRTLGDLSFRSRFGVTVLAVYRKGQAFPTGIRAMPLEVGDVLLLQGSRERLGSLWQEGELWLLDQADHFTGGKRKGLLALAVFLGAILLSGLGLLPLSIAFLLAAVSVIVTRCVSAEEAYQFIDWRLIVLIAGMTSVGLAMEKTEAADWLASRLVDLVLPLGPSVLLAGFAVITILLTQPMSNAAAALVMLPVALTTAEQIGANPRTFAVLITLSASISFITPFEPSSILAFNAGKYRFRDFVKVGFPLTLLNLAILLVLVPYFWPL